METPGEILPQSFGNPVSSNIAGPELMETPGDISPQSFDAPVRSNTVQRLLNRLESVGDPVLAQVATLWVEIDHALLNAGRYISQLQFVKHFEDKSLPEAASALSVITIMGVLHECFDLHCGPARGLSPFGGTSVTFHICSSLAMAAYYQAVLTDPGAVPEDWEGQPDSMPRFVLEGRGQFNPIERKRTTGELRYCNKELKFKPDRAHYCSVMDRNVLRMDHYCPWLNNCVGHRNHKFFILFLAYTSFTTLLMDVELMKAIISTQPSAMHKFMLFQGLSVSATMSLLVTPFFGFHCWLLSKNLTTIEYCERRGLNSNFASPYDLGIIDNIKSILGEQVWTWPLPLGNPAGDGLVWETRRAIESNDSFSDQNADEQERTSNRMPVFLNVDNTEHIGQNRALLGSMNARQNANWRPAPAAQRLKRKVRCARLSHGLRVSDVMIAMMSVEDTEMPGVVGGTLHALGELSSDTCAAARQGCLGLRDGHWQEKFSGGWRALRASFAHQS